MHALTVSSRRGAGHVVALDLVGVVLAAKVAMRARLAEDFANYLVTDENPCDMGEAEMAACWPFDVGSSASVLLRDSVERELDGIRAAVEAEVLADECQGDALPVWRDYLTGRVILLGGRGVSEPEMRDGFEVLCGEVMDAPDHIPAGATRKYTLGSPGSEVCAGRVDFLRAGWFE